ncbi:MAG: hypothetical protein R3223_03225 [Longimicrobiales bacterium]|nr:hypothetical protein [Longimicrobiales bacterium]
MTRGNSRPSPCGTFAGAARAVGAALLTALALAAHPPSVAAQSAVVDEGTFLLSRNGEAIGTEAYTIRRTGGGQNANYVATGEIEIDLDGEERQISVALEATTAGSIVSAYQLKEGGAHQTEIYLTRADRRFQARIVTPAGEQVREYRAAPGIVLLERWVTHHYFFTVAKISGASTTLPALTPRTGERFELQVSDTGTERIQVAGQAVEARRIHLANGGIERDVWVDEQGRVLLAVNHETGFRAERRDLPR